MLGEKEGREPKRKLDLMELDGKISINKELLLPGSWRQCT